jgi:hypothetical protein
MLDRLICIKSVDVLFVMPTSQTFRDVLAPLAHTILAMLPQRFSGNLSGETLRRR